MTPSVLRHGARRVDLARVHLTVADAQGVEIVAVAPATIAAAVNESRPPLSSTTARCPVAPSPSGPCSQTPRASGAPDVLVRLELQPDRQPIGQDPGGQILAWQDAVHGRQEHGGAAIEQAVASDDVACEFVVAAILDDELYLVCRRQQVEVGPAVLLGLAAGRDT